jgi:SAM-dependent methyltransferase
MNLKWMKERALSEFDAGADGIVVVDAEETALARAYLSAILKDERGFVERVSTDDEMYIFIRNNIPHKQYTLYQYLYGGREAIQVIDNIVQAAGKSLGGIGSFLDFACGYGKSTRFLVRTLSPQRIWVSDIYTGAVDFQKAQFGVNGFCSAHDPNEVKFPRKFEVIYVGSLFSHLPAPRFKAWLARLHEMLEDNGVLIFSTAGKWAPRIGGEPSDAGLVFICESESQSLPRQEYGATWVTEEWVRGLAAELGIAQVYYLEFELWAQDVFVATKLRMPALDGRMTNPYPRGTIEIAAVNADGQLRVSGWAMDRRHGAPVQSVRIEIDGALNATAKLGLARPDVAAYFERPDSERAGWCYAGDAVCLTGASAPAVVKVLIEGSDGSITCLVSLIEGGASTRGGEATTRPGSSMAP